MYPRVPALISAARNVLATLNRKESEMQTLLRLQNISSSFQLRTGGSPPWPEIKRSIMRSRPPCEDKLDAMITFVAARCGGPRGTFLQSLSVFHRNFVEDSIRGGVPASLYTALADLKHHYLALALLKTAWTCPPGEVRQLQCEWVTGAEVLALGLGKDEQVSLRAKLAEELLSRARMHTDLVF